MSQSVAMVRVASAETTTVGGWSTGQRRLRGAVGPCEDQKEEGWRRSENMSRRYNFAEVADGVS
jgi:hypothetical protein